MTMLPQPPPDAPAPPPSEAALLSRRKWNWLLRVGSFSVCVVLVILAVPPILRSRKSVDLTKAVSNARQIGMNLCEFEAEYGKFPDATTIAAVRKKSGSTLPLGTKSSNDFFRQLLAAGIATTESIFYAKIKNVRKPDGVESGGDAIAKGECGYAYLSGLSSKGNPSRPLVVTPLIPGTDRFDPTRFDGKAVILKMDNSVSSHPIDKAGHVIIGGVNILDPTHPVWGSDKPVLVWQD